MKISKYLFIILAIFLTSESEAAVRTLNNNNPSPGQYTTWAAVESVCGFSDTVLVSGSPISYGNITINVFGLTLIGTGHNPQKQNPLVSSFDTIVFNVGSVKFNGIKAQLIRQTTTLFATTVTIENCMTVIDIQNAGLDAYYTLKNNILYQYDSNIAIGATFDNTYVNPALICNATNNLFFGSIMLIGVSASIKNSNFSNNVFMRRGDASGGSSGSSYNQPFVGSIGFNNFVFNNNVVNGYSGFEDGSSFLNSTCLHNCIRSVSNLFTSFPNDNATSFVNVTTFTNVYPSLSAFNYGQDYHLAPSSPLINAGTDGTDIGVYGGPYGSLYTLFGEPSIPQIKQMNTPSKVVSGNSFNLNIMTTIK